MVTVGFTAAILLCTAALQLIGLNGELINYEDIGAIPEDESYDSALSNGQLLNQTLLALNPGDIFFVPNKTFTLVGGIQASDISDVVFLIDGTLSFTSDRETWPKGENGRVLHCIALTNLENVLFTSSGKGTIDGNGMAWWGAINYLKHQEDRPKLINIDTSKNLTVEHLLLKDSPDWTLNCGNSDGLIIRYTDVDARITELDAHDPLDLTAFNTDGFDVTGRNVHIHDCNIWNQDDCISVKDGSEDMLFERINASGLGLVIGSIGGSRVNNITFRDSSVWNSFKGIYLKTRWSDEGPVGEEASISNVKYENIVITNPEQWAIWMGPAQQTGQPCQLGWPYLPRTDCIMSGYQTWSNITFTNILVNNTRKSPGILLGNASNPMHNVVFDNVVVLNPGEDPWGDDYYLCESVEGIATGGTVPVPPCFEEIDNNPMPRRPLATGYTTTTADADTDTDAEDSSDADAVSGTQSNR